MELGRRENAAHCSINLFHYDHVSNEKRKFPTYCVRYCPRWLLFESSWPQTPFFSFSESLHNGKRRK